MSTLLIVGGGPVGLFTGIVARAAGRRAVVFDRAHPEIDKGCGEGLMPSGLALLSAAGVVVDPEGCALFRGIRYIDGEREATGDFPGGPGLGIRRLYLHRALVARAEAVGVELRWGVAVEGLAPGGVQSSEGFVSGDVVVGADGLHSQVRRWAGLGLGPGPKQRFGVRQHFRLKPWSEHVEVYWAEGCEAYVTPAGPERVGVAFLWSGEKARFGELLARFPRLAARLEGAPVDSQARGAGPLHQRLKGVVGGPELGVPVALVGDAAGYLDAITGEGLTLGFHQAHALVQAVGQGRLSDYAEAHARLVRVPFLMIRLLLLLERWPWLRRRVVAALEQEPEVFGRMLAINEGSLPPWGIGLGGGVRLVGRVLVGGLT